MTEHLITPPAGWDGGELWLEATRRNSTVLGYEDGEEGTSFWDWLLWDEGKLNAVRVDRGFPNSAGEYGYAYLHVPAKHPEDGDEGEVVYRVRCLYEPGDVLLMREEWRHAIATPATSAIRYKGESRAILCDQEGEGDPVGTTSPVREIHTEEKHWRPADTMPAWAVRKRYTVLSVRPEKRDKWGWVLTTKGASE